MKRQPVESSMIQSIGYNPDIMSLLLKMLKPIFIEEFKKIFKAKTKLADEKRGKGVIIWLL